MTTPQPLRPGDFVRFADRHPTWPRFVLAKAKGTAATVHELDLEGNVIGKIKTTLDALAPHESLPSRPDPAEAPAAEAPVDESEIAAIVLANQVTAHHLRQM